MRLAIAIGCVLIGAIHLRLYFDSYRDIPSRTSGAASSSTPSPRARRRSLVLVWPNRLALLAPLVLANATLVAFALSRTDRGIFDFTERGWNPTPDAALSVGIEIATGLLAVLALYRERPLSTSRRGRSCRRRASPAMGPPSRPLLVVLDLAHDLERGDPGDAATAWVADGLVQPLDRRRKSA